MATTSSRSSSPAARTPPRSMRCSRCWCAPAAVRRWPRPAHPRGVVEEGHDHARGAPRDVRLCQRGDGAVGRAGGDLRHRRALGDRRHGPQRLAAAALHGPRSTSCSSSARRPAWCVSTKRSIIEKGRVGPGQMIAVDLEGRPASTRTARSRISSPPSILIEKWTENIDELDPHHRAGPRAAPVREGRAAPPSVGGRPFASRISSSSFIRWRKTARKPSARWATTRRSPCSRSTTGRCRISSGRISARSPTRRSIPCAKIG